MPSGKQRGAALRTRRLASDPADHTKGPPGALAKATWPLASMRRGCSVDGHAMSPAGALRRRQRPPPSSDASAPVGVVATSLREFDGSAPRQLAARAGAPAATSSRCAAHHQQPARGVDRDDVAAGERIRWKSARRASRRSANCARVIRGGSAQGVAADPRAGQGDPSRGTDQARPPRSPSCLGTDPQRASANSHPDPNGTTRCASRSSTHRPSG